MMEQMASQVRSLRSSLPLQQFKKNAPIKIACIGNCILNKQKMLLNLNPNIDVVFTSNLSNWGNYHAESFKERAEEADIVLGIAVSNNNNKLFQSPSDLRATYGDKCVIVPSVWLDGTDTLQSFSISGNVRFFGGDPIVERAKEIGFDEAYEELIRGKLNTDPTVRMSRSLANLRSVESTSDFTMSDYIEDTYQLRPVANAIGHPSNIVVREIFCRLVKTLNLDFKLDTMFTPHLMGRLSLPGTQRVFSPYDVEELKLTYDHEPHWMLQAKSLLNLMRSKVKTGTYLPIENFKESY